MKQPVIDSSISFGPLRRRLLTRYGRCELNNLDSDMSTRQAKQWHKIVVGLRVEGSKFLKTHPSEDLETALKALTIAKGSLEEVAEHYE